MEELRRELGFKYSNRAAQQWLKSKDARRLKEQEQSLTFPTQEKATTKAKKEARRIYSNKNTTNKLPPMIF